jgi:hypothetical protein
MTAELIPDDFWNLIEPLLMPQRSSPKGGRPRIPDRACLKGILFVLRSQPAAIHCGCCLSSAFTASITASTLSGISCM